jgi:hypothetical protein
MHGLVDGLDLRGQRLHRPRPRQRRVGDDLLARGAVIPGVVEDAVVARVGPGEDRRVVGEGDRRQRRQRAVGQPGAHGQQPGHVRRLAGGHHVVEDVGVGAVPQDADHVVGPVAGVEELGEGAAVLAGQQRVRARGPGRPEPAARAGVGAQQGQDRGRNVDEAARAGHHPVLADAGAGQHERRPHLHRAQRTVLAALTAVVLPVVGRRVQAHEVGGGGVVEELGDVLVGVRIGLPGAVGPAVRQLVGERREPVGGRVAQRVAASDLDVDETPPLAVAVGRRDLTAEPDPAVDRASLVGVAVGGHDHVDDGLECGVEQRVGHPPDPVGIGRHVGGGTRVRAVRERHGRTVTDPGDAGMAPA